MIEIPGFDLPEIAVAMGSAKASSTDFQVVNLRDALSASPFMAAFAAEDVAGRLRAGTGLQVDSWIRTNAQFFTAMAAQKLTNTLIRVFVGLTVALGIAQGAFDLALGYATQREQFGRKIGQFQGLQWMLADMHRQLEAARLLIYHAADNAGDGFPDALEAATAKVTAAETAVAWKVAIERTDGPTFLALSRQKVPLLDRRQSEKSALASAEGLRRGGYVLAEASRGRPRVIVIASGGSR